MSAGNPFKIVPMTDFQGKSPHGAKNLIISRKASNHRPYIFQRNIVYTPWFMAPKYGAQGIACHNCIVYQTLKKLPKFQNPTESRSEILTESNRKTQKHTHPHTHRDTHKHSPTHVMCFVTRCQWTIFHFIHLSFQWYLCLNHDPLKKSSRN